MASANCKNSQGSSIISLLLLTGLIFCSGCWNNEQPSLWRQIKELGSQKSDLAIRVEELEKENESLRQQLKTLQKLDPNERLEAINVLEKIVITSRSGLYDKDGDRKKETLVVYVETIDSAGDRVKTPGWIQVQLWNLNTQDARNAVLNQWTIEPHQLKGYWVSTMLTNYYRLTFPLKDVIQGDESGLTVRVKFVDYFSGKILEDQRALK